MTPVLVKFAVQRDQGGRTLDSKGQIVRVSAGKTMTSGKSCGSSSEWAIGDAETRPRKMFNSKYGNIARRVILPNSRDGSSDFSEQQDRLINRLASQPRLQKKLGRHIMKFVFDESRGHENIRIDQDGPLLHDGRVRVAERVFAQDNPRRI